MNFSINNFRVFNEEQEFNFAPITVLVGKNNSGKSTLVRSIQLFHENFKKKNQINRLSEFEISELIPSLGNFNKIIGLPITDAKYRNGLGDN